MTDTLLVLSLEMAQSNNMQNPISVAPTFSNLTSQHQSCEEKKYHSDFTYNQGDNGQVNGPFGNQNGPSDLKSDVLQALNRYLLISKQKNEESIMKILTRTIRELEDGDGV